MAATNGDSKMGDIASKAPEGTILPPQESRQIIEKTAGYVARNGERFEVQLREKQGSNLKMSFVQPEDAYYPYYRWRIAEIKEGRGNAVSAGRETEVSFQGREERKGPEPPEEFAFSARVPNLSAQDLDVVKLTALFVAKNGKGWMTALSQKEAGNPQFDFLRSQHTLNQFFTRLVDQYTDLLTGDSANGGKTQKKRVQELEQNVENRFQVMERAKKRAEWVKHQEAQKVAKEEKQEKERVEYAQIDWHDFVVVETVVFTEADEETDLPAPTTMNDLQSASLEQKAAMSINPNLRIEEGFPSFEDSNQDYGQQQQQQYPPPPATQMPPPQNPYLPYTPTPPQAQAHQPPGPPVDNFAKVNTVQEDRDRARAAQEAARAAASTKAPIKVRENYVPRAQQARQKAPNTSICPNCKQHILNDEMEHHMRIEMQSSAYAESQAVAAKKMSTTNLSTFDSSSHLKRMASQRKDLFDSVTGDAITEEEASRRKRQEVGAGLAAAPAPGGVGAPPPGGQGRDVQEQIRALHQKHKTG